MWFESGNCKKKGGMSKRRKISTEVKNDSVKREYGSKAKIGSKETTEVPASPSLLVRSMPSHRNLIKIMLTHGERSPGLNPEVVVCCGRSALSRSQRKETRKNHLVGGKKKKTLSMVKVDLCGLKQQISETLY